MHRLGTQTETYLLIGLLVKVGAVCEISPSRLETEASSSRRLSDVRNTLWKRLHEEDFLNHVEEDNEPHRDQTNALPARWLGKKGG